MSKYNSFSDSQLIYACREGVEAAWDALVSRYERLVYTIPRRYGLTQAEVDDVFQSVWLLLLQHLDRIKQPERISAWLVTTARRESIKRRRTTEYKRVSYMEPDFFSKLEQTDRSTPEEIVIRYEQQQAVRHAMERLGERCRRLLQMLYYDSPKASYATIAATLNLAVGSIGAIRGRCLRKLNQLLEE
jgi:RNA polymerase sigma factor (sigma-70 family)